MTLLSTAIFATVGVVNALPAVGVLGSRRLRALYGIPIDDPTLLVLMRHRAVLFGIVGGVLLEAAFAPAHRPVALVVGLASMLSFVVLARASPRASPLGRIVVIDIVASAALAASALL